MENRKRKLLEMESKTKYRDERRKEAEQRRKESEARTRKNLAIAEYFENAKQNHFPPQ